MRAIIIHALMLSLIGAPVTTLALPVDTSEQAENINRMFAALTSREKDWEKRSRAVEELSKVDFTLIAPRLVRAYVDHITPQAPGSGIPRLNEDLEWPAAVWYASGRLWNLHVDGEQAVAKTEILLQLLSDETNQSGRALIIDALGGPQWSKAVEGPFASLMKNPIESDWLRVRVAEKLVFRCRAKYIGEVFVVSEQVKSFDLKCRSISVLLNRYYVKADARTERRIVKRAFAILIGENKKGGRPQGYFLARDLERYLGEQFAPDQKQQQYQDEHGLKDRFFDETVENALAWWERSKRNYE